MDDAQDQGIEAVGDCREGQELSSRQQGQDLDEDLGCCELSSRGGRHGSGYLVGERVEMTSRSGLHGPLQSVEEEVGEMRLITDKTG